MHSSLPFKCVCGNFYASADEVFYCQSLADHPETPEWNLEEPVEEAPFPDPEEG
jgi:hypothetical protein